MCPSRGRQRIDDFSGAFREVGIMEDGIKSGENIV